MRFSFLLLAEPAEAMVAMFASGKALRLAEPAEAFMAVFALGRFFLSEVLHVRLILTGLTVMS